MREDLASVTYRGLTADHYMDGKKYYIHYYKPGMPWKTLMIVQVRGLKEPLTEEELKHHIDCRWNDYYRERGEYDKMHITNREKMRERVKEDPKRPKRRN